MDSGEIGSKPTFNMLIVTSKQEIVLHAEIIPFTFLLNLQTEINGQNFSFVQILY